MKRLLCTLLVSLLAAGANATPNPTGGSGTAGHGNTYTVTGTLFTTKVSPCDGSAKPAYYFDFEDGTLGAVSAFSACGALTLGQQNMTVTTEARGSSAKDLKSDAVNWAQFTPYGGIAEVDILVPAASAARSGKVYYGIKRKSSRTSYTHLNGGVTQYENWKFWRSWVNTNGSGYPNAYNAQNADAPSTCSGGGSHASPTVEAGSGSNYVKTSSAYRLPSSSWMWEERTLQYASANTIGDGLFKIWQDGQLVVSRTDWKTDPSASFPAAGYRRTYFQDDPSNLTDCGGSTVAHDVYKDDLVFDYGDDSWSRVLLCNASTLAASTICEYQPATSWSSTSITFTQKFGELGTSSDKYIYIVDNADAVNASGRLLASGVGNPAPTITSINVSTASYLGGGTSTATGTGFITGITCKVGGVSAATTFTSATSLWFTFPAGTSGSLVDLVCTNTDAQSATLGGAVQYSTAAETPIYVDPNPAKDDGSFPPFAR